MRLIRGLCGLAVLAVVGFGLHLLTGASFAQSPSEAVRENRQLAPDINPDSLSRLPLVKREDLDEAGKKAFDVVTDPKSRLRAALAGPAGIWMHVPELSPHIREINWYLRNRISLDLPLAELAILATVRETDGEFEWASHEPAALKAGISQNVVDIIKYRRPIEGASPKEAMIIKFARQLLGEKRMPPETYAEALNLFGQKTLVELVLLMANYLQTSVILRAFDQQLRPDLKPMLPVAKR